MEHADVAVIGAGAAGLLAALAARGAVAEDGSLLGPDDGPSVVLLDGQQRPGKKILISGGGRCNVTNASVTDTDFDSQHPHLVRGVLRGFPVTSVRHLFAGLGVQLAEEPLGKLFPRQGRAKGILSALLGAVEGAGVKTRFGTRVGALEQDADAWQVTNDLIADRVVISTGGLSVPETGSDGFGLALARRLGHTIVPTVPALAPLLGSTPDSLAGLTTVAILRVVDEQGRVQRHATGGLLFTHRGVSGPAALDVSVAVERARSEDLPFRVLADLWTAADPGGAFAPYRSLGKPPGACLPDPPPATEPAAMERTLMEAAKRGGGTLGSFLERRLPRRFVRTMVAAHEKPLAQLTRGERRDAAVAVCALDLGVTGSEGYRKAEVTSGGVPLRDLDRRSLESRLAAGIHFCGEVCDATGRLGGFNFQWAWSSGFAVGSGIRRTLAP